jgi:hypothetical protein
MRPTTFSLELYDDIGPEQDYNGHKAPTILPYEFEGYTADERWNGWACPYFTLEQASKIVQRHNALCEDSQQHGEDPRFPRHLAARAWYDEHADEFCFPLVASDEVDRFGSSWRDGLKLYPVGAFGWTWAQNGDWDEEEVVRLRRIIADQGTIA